VDNSISKRRLAPDTTTHEDFHVVEYGYYATGAHTWFDENCSMMARSGCTDGVNDYMDYLTGATGFRHRKMKHLQRTFEHGRSRGRCTSRALRAPELGRASL